MPTIVQNLRVILDNLIDEPGTFSKPLSALSKEIEKIDEKENS